MGKQNETTQVAEVITTPTMYVAEKDQSKEMQLVSEIIMWTEQFKQTVLIHSVEIGKRLCEAKKLVKHGQWTEWLSNRVNYSQRTANNYMKLYKELGETGILEKSQSIANLSYTQALTLLDAPKEEREKLAEDAKDKTIKELKEEIKKTKQQLKEEQDSTKEVLEEIRQKHENELTIRETRIEELVRAQSGAEKNLAALEAKQQQALKDKDLEAQKRIEEATQEEKKKLKESSEEISDLKKEIAKLQAKKQEEIDLAVKAAKELSKAELSSKEKKIQEIRERMQQNTAQHQKEIAAMKKDIESEKNKNSSIATLSKCAYAVDEVLDDYAKLADIVMSIANTDRVLAKNIMADLEKGFSGITDKIKEKITN